MWGKVASRIQAQTQLGGFGAWAGDLRTSLGPARCGNENLEPENLEPREGRSDHTARQRTMVTQWPEMGEGLLSLLCPPLPSS